MVKVKHDSQDLFYRQPFGAVEKGSDVELKIEVQCDTPINSINLITVSNRDEINRSMDLVTEGDRRVYSRKLYTSCYKGLIWYYFEINLENKTYYYGNNDQGLGGEGVLKEYIPRAYQITVHDRNLEVPSWYREGVMYQIFPDRFYNGNPDGRVNRPNRDMVLRADWNEPPHYVKGKDGRIQFYDYFGGNLLGIEKKLDYLKELGISVIYLNPIFEAESNHKYDTGDYLRIDRMFGDEESFSRLCKKGSEIGISIILDGVFSHTGSDSVYFNREGRYDSLGAYQSVTSPYYGWYRFKSHPDNYESWWGIDVLPNVEEENEGYKQLILGDGGVIEKWTSLGASGWRLDVADELPDSFIKSLRKKLKSVRSDSVLIGEVWEDASNKKSYGELREYLLGDELDSIMNYPFRDNFLSFLMEGIDAYELHRNIMSLYENYPREHFYSNMNLVGTHDSMRVINSLAHIEHSGELSDEEKRSHRLKWAQREEAIERLKLLVAIQMTFPGIPSIYYGDEVGLEGYEDPYNRRTYPWGSEDREIFDWYKKIIAIRNENQVFKSGDFKSLPLGEDIYCFIRSGESMGITLINRGYETKKVEVELEEDYQFKDQLDKTEINTSYKVLITEIKPRTCIILVGTEYVK